MWVTSHNLIKLINKSNHKCGICCLLEIQFWCCRGVGHLYPIFKPHCGAFTAFPKQNDKCQTNARGGRGMGMELREPLNKNVILPGKLSILCDI